MKHAGRWARPPRVGCPLLLQGGYADIALRDFGLLLGALTLARLTRLLGPRANVDRVRWTKVSSEAHRA